MNPVDFIINNWLIIKDEFVLTDLRGQPASTVGTYTNS